MDITTRKYAIKIVAILCSFTLCMIGPAHAYFVSGIKTTTTEMRIPFCDPKSDAEFSINLLIQIVVGTTGIVGYIGMELFPSLFENVVTIAPLLVEHELTHTIQLYANKSISEWELRRKIGRIVELSQSADK